MNFEDLTPTNISEIISIYRLDLSWDERMERLSMYLDKSERTVRRWISKLGISEKATIESPQFIKAKERKLSKKKRFLITWAQNDTPIHEKFVSNLEKYAEHINADIHVIAGRYKNPTSVFTDNDYNTWDNRIEKYLDANRHNPHKHIWIMSDIKIQPTAINPMSGMMALSGVDSCVFGSPKVQMETIPVLEGVLPKVMVTTGACTLSNYTDSKAGKKGEFHHTLGFVIVEIKDKSTFFVRQVTATNDGSFSDLNTRLEYINGESKIIKLNSIAGIVLGDIHFGQHDPTVIHKTLKLFEVIKPKNVVLHDVFDGLSINHHDMNNPFIQYERELSGSNSLKDDVECMLEGLEDFDSADYNTIIVRGNHDDFLDKWLQTTDWRKGATIKNALEYMEYSTLILSGKAKNGVIPYLINERFPNFITLNRSESYLIKDWEVAQHGDIGQNGSYGSLNQYRNLNTKIITGHYHSPGRKDGALAVGTSTKLRVNYNIGPSSWLQSHVIIHEDGKTQHINFINGEFTTLF